MGKTSVYLTEDLAAAAKAAGVSLSELIRRGLAAGEPEPLEALIRRVVREELTAAKGSPAGNAQPCPHPKARISKGLCGACGQHAGFAQGNNPGTT